jgi:hypothetical protein
MKNVTMNKIKNWISFNENKQSEILDNILDQISKYGKENLLPSENQFLINYPNMKDVDFSKDLIKLSYAKLNYKLKTIIGDIIKDTWVEKSDKDIHISFAYSDKYNYIKETEIAYNKLKKGGYNPSMSDSSTIHL